MKSRKRRFIQNTSEDDSEKENDELRLYLTIALDEDKEVDYEIPDMKYPIKEWKTECLGTKPQVDKAEHLEEINQNVVIRSNGQKRYFSTLMRVLSIFDRDDLNAVYQLVMDRYQDEIPEGFDRVLWGDLMIMFNPDDEDKFWNSQQDWNIVSWKLHGSSGIVTFEGTLDSEIMEKKSFIARLNKVSSPDGDYLVIYRANGNFRAFNYLMEYSEVTLDGIKLILWGDLKITMESLTEEKDQSDFWSDQQD
ncbi:hypothetical protein Tco_1380173 [Tanacetum coccineum]